MVVAAREKDHTGTLLLDMTPYPPTRQNDKQLGTGIGPTRHNGTLASRIQQYKKLISNMRGIMMRPTDESRYMRRIEVV